MFGLKTKVFGAAEATSWGGSQWAEDLESANCFNGEAGGIVATTEVATLTGWRPVETLRPGDWVMNFDEEWVQVAGIRRSPLWTGNRSCPPSLVPVHVPAGLLGNNQVMTLLPEQFILFESDDVFDLFGLHTVMVQAVDLVGFAGITQVEPLHPVEVVQLDLGSDEAIMVEGGATLFCPGDAARGVTSIADLLSDQPEEAPGLFEDCPKLSGDETFVLMHAIAPQAH